MESNLNIPVGLKEIIARKDAQRVDVKTSIHNMIHLITVTSYNEVKHDSSFGTEIWKYDFENIYNTHFLKEELKKSVLISIKKNENRLTDVGIDLQLEQVEINSKVLNRRIKTQIKLTVTGVIDKTNEAFQHHETFFIGPLSY